jgi:hypothetical protein
MFPPLPGALRWPPDLPTDRGFPAEVHGGVGSFRANAAEVLGLAPVGGVVFSTNVGDGFPALARSPWLARIRRVGLPDRFDARDMAALAHSQFSTGIEDVAATRPAPSLLLVESVLFPRLTRVRLVTDAVRGGMLARALDRVVARVALRCLEVAGGATRGELFRAPAVLGLGHLGLRGCFVGSERYRELAAAPFARLRSLDLTNTFPGAEGVRAFCGSAVLAGLRRLNWGNNSVSGVLAREFAACPETENLRVLDLSGNAVGNDGGAALFTSPHLAGLKVLGLSYCMIGDEALRALLDHSPLADGLAFLDLAGSPASAETKLAVKDRMGDRVRL